MLLGQYLVACKGHVCETMPAPPVLERVISAYEETCNFLRQKHELVLLQQSLSELGDIYWAAKVIPASTELM